MEWLAEAVAAITTGVLGGVGIQLRKLSQMKEKQIEKLTKCPIDRYERTCEPEFSRVKEDVKSLHSKVDAIRRDTDFIRGKINGR